jgi:hypothetical protein
MIQCYDQWSYSKLIQWVMKEVRKQFIGFVQYSTVHMPIVEFRNLYKAVKSVKGIKLNIFIRQDYSNLFQFLIKSRAISPWILLRLFPRLVVNLLS